MTETGSHCAEHCAPHGAPPAGRRHNHARSRRRVGVLAALVGLSLATTAGISHAWESETTHAGMTEQSAFSADLHGYLQRSWGLDRGLFEPLTVEPERADSLLKTLRRFNPMHGFVPDRRGRMSALGWVVAGAALADSPAQFAGHHFLDPTSGKGLSDTTRTLGGKLRNRLGAMMTREKIVTRGIAAHDWIASKENPMGLTGFVRQFELAASAPKPGQRGRHLAGTLVAAGAILHVLQDLGSPSHVRNDLAAHLDRVGESSSDVGSRLERLSALRFGRLGVPVPRRDVVLKGGWRPLFSGAPTSLADSTRANWYSRYTVPGPRAIAERATVGDIALAAKAATGRTELGVTRLGKTRFRVSNGDDRCLFVAEVSGRTVEFMTDDACVLDQLNAIVPTVTSYSTALLKWLFRGRVSVGRIDTGIAVKLSPPGAGTLSLYGEDSRGVRKLFGSIDNDKVSGVWRGPMPPADAVRIVALFSGTDKDGSILVATGSVE